MLTQKEINIIIDTFKPYNPKRIGLFGSVARNEETATSDIDILYNFNSPISLFGLVDIQDELQKKLHKKIDLVSQNSIHPLLKESILNDLKIIYG
ncbi:nucleotidyltransferase family protein [Flavobacterium soyangense]|uniref:Nucleotidyltransferase family protein n=1 Tax=Flavobacterium soyangense TaxID=2023265 RepID=A0A930U861_9FLAO|nr:nucleotidyltransferase family protein [Flavobacterium soyangense]MBF2707255.1 nucleotidyltransferase family protein [Flavobacterium soyangense]